MRLLQTFLSRGTSRPLLQRYLPSSALRQQRHASTWAPATAAVHADAGIDKTSHDGDVAPPIGLSTTFDDGADHVYSRISAPTRQRCEAVLAALEGGEGARAVLFASGNAATHAVLASLARARARTGGRRASPPTASATTARATRSRPSARPSRWLAGPPSWARATSSGSRARGTRTCACRTSRGLRRTR